MQGGSNAKAGVFREEIERWEDETLLSLASSQLCHSSRPFKKKMERNGERGRERDGKDLETSRICISNYIPQS